MPARLIVALSLVQGILFPVVAQKPVGVRPGDRVKVFTTSRPATASRPVTGTLRELGPTTMLVALRTGVDTLIPLAGISELRRIRRKATIGSVLGATVGLLLGAAIAGPPDHSTDQSKALAAGAAVAIAGGIFGARLTGSDVIPLGTVRPHPLPATVVRLASPRLSSPGPVVGTIRSWAVDSVGFQPDGGATVVLGANEVRSIEWPVQRAGRAGLGAGLGVLVGGTIGTIIGAAAASRCSQGAGFLSELCGFNTSGGFLIGGGAGALVGALIGSTFRYAKWESGKETGAHVSVSPRLTPHSAGVVVSIPGVSLPRRLHWAGPN